MLTCSIILYTGKIGEDLKKTLELQKLPEVGSNIPFGKDGRLVNVTSIRPDSTQSIIQVRELEMIERKAINRKPGCPVTFI